MKWLARAPLVWLVLAAGVAMGQAARRGLYEVGLPADPHPKQVARLEIASSPCADRAGSRWYRLAATKVGGETFTIWFSSSANPFRAEANEGVAIHRYLLQEPNQPATEYVDERTGEALPPVFGFVEKLLPRAGASDDGPLFERGTYLGHPLTLREVLAPEAATPPLSVRRLTLRSDLIVGTSRNFRDDGTGRKDPKANYNFVHVYQRTTTTR